MRILVLSAHFDDETIGLGAHIAAWRRAGHGLKLIFLTDGTPRKRKYFANGWPNGAREYRRTRRAEALGAVKEMGVDAGEIIFLRFRDQELAENMDSAGRILRELGQVWRPHWSVGPAWQGGHPDHDACHCLNAALREQAKRMPKQKPRFLEYSLYARAGEEICFLPALAGEKINAQLLPEDWERKRMALRHYHSQELTLKPFPLAPESLQVMPEYDYSKAPEQGYACELWGWKIRAQELSRQFHDFLARQAAQP